ncbi:MAG: hypothetical protein RL199_1071 [Pseudomonadota bacterium]
MPSPPRRPGHAWAPFIAFLLGAASLPALAQPYDPSLSFHTLETEHFFVHFHDGEETLARRAARLAERAYAVAVPLVGPPPRTRTHVVLVDVDDESNGSATPLPRNTIELRAAAPDARDELNQFEDWFWQLVVHEFTHVVHLDTIEGPARLANRLVGKQFSPNLAWPRWFTEGWAVWAESTASRGGRLRSALQEMQLRVSLLEGDPLSLGELSTPPLDFPRGSAWYLYGGRFLAHLVDDSAPDFLAAMSRDNAGSLIPYFLGRVSARHLGKPFSLLYDEWLAGLRRKYASEAAALPPLGEEVRLTTTGERRFAPRLSRDGKRLVSILRDADHRPRLMSFDLAEQRETAVVALLADGVASELPDGRWLVAQQHPFRHYRDHSDLFVADPHRGTLEAVTDGARLSDPDVAADGRIVAVRRPGPGRTELVLFDTLAAAREGRARVLFESAGLHPVATPRFSPDGRQVVFARHEGTSYDLALLSLDDSAVRPLTHDASQDLTPAFGRDGTHVLFSSDRSGVFDVFAFHLATSEVRRRTRVVGGAFEPLELDAGLGYLRFGARGYDLALQPDAAADEAAPEPRPFEAEVDPTPQLDLPDARPYRARDTLAPVSGWPVYGTDPAGTVLGASLHGEDVLQKVVWDATVYASLAAREADGGLTIVDNHFRPALEFSALRQLSLAPGAPAGYVERRTSASVAAAWPFRWALSSAAVRAGLQRTVLTPVFGPADAQAPMPDAGTLGTAFLQLTYSNALRFARSISHVDGRRLAVELRGSSPLLGSDFSSGSVAASWTEYVRLWGRHVAALRLSGGTGFGDLGRRQLVGLGGPSFQGLVSDLIDLSSPTRLLRGFAPNAFAGRSFVLGSAEYRCPLAAPEWAFGTFPLALRRVNGAVFTDAGDAFSATRSPTMHVGVGAELRLEWVAGYRTVVETRLGFARGLGAEGVNQAFVLIGPSF